MVEILLKAGFVQNGRNQYKHLEFGVINLSDESTESDFIAKLISLGAQHQANIFRNAIMLDKQTECCIFNPMA